jgi:hypothetical protein
MRTHTSQYDTDTLARLRKLEALAARPGTPGEGAAARSAIERIKARCAPQQPGFAQPRPRSIDALIGLTLRLDRTADRHNGCCEHRGVVRAGVAMHAYAIRCAKCGKHRGWIKQSTAELLRRMAHDGRLTAAPILRDGGIVP